MKIFISYSRKDKVYANQIFNDLREKGFEPWIDQEVLKAGQKWEIEIKKAINESDFCILVLSQNSVDRRGYFQVELRLAVDVLRTIPDEHIYIIPIRLDECHIPETIHPFQWVDMFPDWNKGFDKVLKAIYSQITPEKHAEEYKKKRVYEVFQTAFQDWRTFGKQDQHLIDIENIKLIFQYLTEFKLSLEQLEYLLCSIAYFPRYTEFDTEILKIWLSKLDSNQVYEIFENASDHSNPKVRQGCMRIIERLGNTSLVDIVLDKIKSDIDIEVKRISLRCMTHLGKRLSTDIAQNIFDSHDDWVIQSYALYSFPENRSCLLISDGTDFAAELGGLAQKAGFRLVTLSDSMPWDLREIDFEILKVHELLMIVRGEHFMRVSGNDYYSEIRQFVLDGGTLFATSWVCWENVYNYEFTNVLPFLHIQDTYNEKVMITCKPTENELAHKLFPEQISYVSSFELLQGKDDTVVLFETDQKIPVFGFHRFGKGVCYYLNTCQHYCLGKMSSPFKTNSQLFMSFQRVFQWIFETSKH